MQMQRGNAYRAKTASAEIITFRVTDKGDGQWIKVDLMGSDGPEPDVWLNTNLLLWISTEERRSTALSKATEEVIEALERTTEPPSVGSGM